MHIQKRVVGAKISNDPLDKLSAPIEQKTHKCWRRFMNARATDRAYIPSDHGIYIFLNYTQIYK